VLPNDARKGFTNRILKLHIDRVTIHTMNFNFSLLTLELLYIEDYILKSGKFFIALAKIATIFQTLSFFQCATMFLLVFLSIHLPSLSIFG
jgi:hypothetical protein